MGFVSNITAATIDVTALSTQMTLKKNELSALKPHIFVVQKREKSKFTKMCDEIIFCEPISMQTIAN